ncbi:hypothetical protein [Nostoc sp. CCY0012]|uniref:hypothetical protein n=1 Tax=Nostoc sp. CCY0012 TaxID=1056123 RepID=UPI0039C64052
MNRLTLAKLKKIAAEKGYEVRFDRGCYKIFQKVADFDSLWDAEEFFAQNRLPPPLPSPPPAPKILRPHNTIDISLLSSGKYQIRVLDEIINQGYPDLDGKKYLDVLKTVEISKILDSYPLSVGMKLSIAIPFNSSESWFLNFEIVSLAIQSLKNGNYLFVILQPIPRLTSSDHYLSIYTYRQ